MDVLAGEYHDAGYGSLVFKPVVETESEYLAAERRDMVYQYKVRLEHVSGDDWVAYYLSLSGSRLPAQSFKAHFKFDGQKPSALEITMGDDTPGVESFTVTFTRVA